MGYTVANVTSWPVQKLATLFLIQELNHCLHTPTMLLQDKQEVLLFLTSYPTLSFCEKAPVKS